MSIFFGILTGVVIGVLNAFFLYITVANTINLEKKKAKGIVILSLLVRMSGLAVLLVLIIKSGKINFLAVAVSLFVITLFSPYKIFFKNIKKE